MASNTNRRGIPMPFVSRSRRVDPPSSAAVVPADRPEDAPRVSRSSMVDSAIYARGRRVASPTSLADTYRRARRHARTASPGSACTGPPRRS